MNWSDWEFIWKRQRLPAGRAADTGELVRVFEAKRRRMERALLVRDTSEAAAGVLVAAAFALSWLKMGREAWPMGLAIALVLAVSAFFCFERFRTHRGRLGPDAPLLARIEDQIAELRHQRRLLHNVAAWYLAPIAGSWAIAVFVLARAAARHAPPGFFADLMHNPVTAAFIILYFLILVPLCFVGAWILNRRAAIRQLDPGIEELERLHRELTSTGQPGGTIPSADQKGTHTP